MFRPLSEAFIRRSWHTILLDLDTKNWVPASYDKGL